MTSPTGYDPTFLAIPSIPALAMPNTAGLVDLSYTHFTVSMNTVRRLTAVTAVNIDGGSLQDVERTDDWKLDPRLPADQQAGPEIYVDNDLDRGHLVRRRDPVWGPIDVARQANIDTFHYTVCAPQTSVFNQSTDLWLGLEDYVLSHAKTYRQRLSVFSGSVFTPTDPRYRGIEVPRRYFKIAAWFDGSTLGATGYILDQSPSLDPILEKGIRFPIELTSVVPPLGPYRTYEVPITDIASMTGLTMGPLVDADRYVVPKAAVRGETRWTPLTSHEQIGERI